MNNYTSNGSQRNWPKVVLIVLVVFIFIVVGAGAWAHNTYMENLKPVSNSETSQSITIELGATPTEIANLLQNEGLIKSTWAFEWYVRNTGLRDKIQAGTYSLKPSLSTQEIVDTLTHGRVETDLVTILPGKRLDEVKDALINHGFEPQAVERALEADNYANHPALADKPDSASLEGYLYPESFHKTAETTPEQIIEASLDEMHKRLTDEIRSGITNQGLSVHQGIILASIIEQEVSDHNPEDRPKVAQVFLRRLDEGMALESNATTDYGAILDNKPPTSSYSSLYNTYQNPGLPPGPISNVTLSSLEAVVRPADTNYLFFVSGDDCLEAGGTCTNYFSHTNEEHQRNVQLYCRERCQQ
ncbi:MAG: endolytic transglycosylase MltG [Candidatus Saccharibacteria bacterium]|nr:endolytic transglycosylase MltG [Candidatus Saccharibacteria bacterium]